MAHAEDFNPLRIRPYVNLARPEEEGPAPVPPAFEEQGPGNAAPPQDDTRPAAPAEHPAARTMPLRPVPTAAAPYGARTTDDTFVAGPPGGGPAGHGDAPAPRRTRTVLLAAAAAVVVVAGAAFATGAFDSAPEEPLALPATTSSAPALVTESAPASSSPSPTATSPSPTATRATTRPTPSRTTRSATPTRSPVTTPSPRPTPTATTPSPRQTTPKPPANTLPPGSLAQGSSGPEVMELQDRLYQEWMYSGPINGRYTSRVTDAVARFQSYMSIEEDPEGVYGPATRAALEARTREP
ncbi:peptidoglycan-binding protein [Streptomyces sp. NPDC004111]|uniref:peptidoglycan-binding domain-containing protein n=1 Tax=Streptomyces sp. NPDC004111 TaxID=3364690 RepID=UPI0036CC00B8